MQAIDLPLPPLPLRELVGHTDPGGFENPDGAPIWPGLSPEQWRHYVDFGCGCGRSARRLMQQAEPPERYTGIDLHAGMVRWCQENLQPRASGFRFVHHNVYSPCLNPDWRLEWTAPLPVEDSACTLLEATSVFTHLLQGQTEFYLDEVVRILAPAGLMMASFFLFDKESFPFLQDDQNALYVNAHDPTNAVVYDRRWLEVELAARGLGVKAVIPPTVRGFHWSLRIGHLAAGERPVQLPADTAPPGRRPPPLLRAQAHQFGPETTEASDPSLVVVHPDGRRPISALPPPNPRLHDPDFEQRIRDLERQVRRLRRRLRATETARPSHGSVLARIARRVRQAVRRRTAPR